MAEKNVSAVDRGLRDLYEKGNAALQHKNLDYAIALFNQVLQREPAFYDCRQALRQAQLTKAGASGGFFKKMIGTASASPLIAKGQLALRKDPIEAMQVAEQILNGDPNSAMAHKLLADAALAAGFPRTALLSLELIYKQSPGDRVIAMKLAEANSVAGNVARGESILRELLRTNPQDPEINQALKNLSASRTMKEGGYGALAGGQGSYRDILRNKQEAVSLEQEKREVKDEDVATRLIREQEARLVGEPDNLRLVRSIAELYTQSQNYDKALEYYQRILSTEGAADATLEKSVADVTIRRFDQKIDRLDAAAPDYNEQLDALKKQKQDFILAECKTRADRYPNDLQIRFELGVMYFQAGKITEAIGEFQRAQNNPNKRVQTLSYLGQCFAKRNMNDMASRSFQNALKDKLVFDEEKKELLYMLGCVLEKMNRMNEAIEQFKQIYEMDIGYRDVANKVDSFYSTQA